MILNNIKSKQKVSGFTIVELLVVIVVIGILAAITIVSYTGVTSRANANANKMNAKSVLSAAEALKADTTNLYPVPHATSATMVSNINTGNIAKVPTGLNVTGQASGATTGTLPTSTNTGVLYMINAATVATATGICVYYYDNQAGNVQSLTGGAATAAVAPTTTTLATCT